MEKRILKKELPLNQTKATVSNSIFYLPCTSGHNSDPRIVSEDILQGLFKQISIELGVDTDEYDEPASQQDEEMEVDEPNSFQNSVVEEKPTSVDSFSSLPSLDPATETEDSFSEDESQNFSADELQLNSDFYSDNENDCDHKFETSVFLCEMEREDDEPVKKKSDLELLPPLSSIMPQITSLSVYNAKVENELNLKTSLPVIASVDESGEFGHGFPKNELMLTQEIRSDYGDENLAKLNYDEIPPDEMSAQEKSKTNTKDSSRSVGMFTETEEKFTVGKPGTHERIEVSDVIVKKILADLDTATLKSMRLVSRKGLLLATEELQKRIVIPLRLTGIFVGNSIRSVECLATAMERSKLFPCNSFQVYTRALHSLRIQYVFDSIGTRIKKLSLILDYTEDYYKKVSFRECTIMDEVKHLLARQTPNLEDFEMKAYLPCHWREGFEGWDAHALEKNASGAFQNFKLHCVFGSANCNDF